MGPHLIRSDHQLPASQELVTHKVVGVHDYRMLRIDEAPEVDVLLTPSGDAPGRRR